MFLFDAEDIIRSNIKTNCARYLFFYTRQVTLGPQYITVGYITHFRYSSSRPIGSFSEKLIRLATIYLIQYLLPEIISCLIYL